MAKVFRLMRYPLLFFVVVLNLSACMSANTSPPAGVMTDVGTPRNQTLIFQTFDGKTNNPDNMNPMMSGYAVWRGFRELGWGSLWEMNTATGHSYGELADGFPQVLDSQHTGFRVKLKPGIYWSDGVELTTDDVIYTLDTYFKDKSKLTGSGVSVITNYVKSYKKIDKYTFEVTTVKPAYDFVTVMGVYTWGPAFIIVPRHVFEKQADVSTFLNTNPVTLGPYTVKSYDKNGYWQLWQRRSDWKRSAWGWMGEPKAQYVLYKDFGTEETRTLAFIKDQYDVDTFMSPDSIQGAEAKNSAISTFSSTMPFNDMGDACSYGILMNQEKAPFNQAAVRWALALTLNLQGVGMNALNGQFRASALPMSDTHILRPLYFNPLQSWLKDLTLSDGYHPYDPSFANELSSKLQSAGNSASALPQAGQATSDAFGLGWWKYDPAEAQKLLSTVGIKKNSNGVYTLPNGSIWQPELVVPSDWNTVMERIGFSIGDSWKKAGIQVNVRQVDNGEFTTVQNTNSKLTMELNWNSCVFNSNYLNSWRSIQPSNLLPADSNTSINGNPFRWNDPTVSSLLNASSHMDSSSPQFIANGQAISKEFITNMAYINLMNIPTTIPTNSYYWRGFPKQSNYYSAPYSWWSSAKMIVLHIQPTGK
ncbi:peptide ABC transporter substrate-binding protein [Dictyobacter sp. S3.2.2.5]|uniref:Peptide ABC transporter substrate-binding protein n=1 Tax=Dictyobacter halimunensis TaxID=3026934 RepID=A0ABQ6FIX6_9CHLR|nr:peptide ABC transporter substrate-binding protein [Dictyobacter sp. S3.2.2.5]